MKKNLWKKSGALALVAGLSLSMLAACGGDSSDGDSVEVKEIVLGHVYSETHNINISCIDFKEYIEEASGGTMTVNIQPNSVLGGDEAMLEMCAVGTVTLMTPSVASIEMYASDWSIVSMPYLFNDTESTYAALDGELGDYLKSTLDGTEFVALGFNSNGIRNMSNNVRPITCLEDLSGLKMRVMNNATYITWMNALGANATPMGFDEVFTGLSQGTVEGQENSASLTYESKFYEVQKYYSITEHVYDMNAIICNRDFYESLTDEEKEIFDYGVQTYIIDQQRQMESDANDEMIQALADEGMEINYLDDTEKDAFRDALVDVYAASRETLGDEIWALVEMYQ